MNKNVTAILVAKQGGVWLSETLEALENQTLKPRSTIVITLGENKNLLDELAEHGVTNTIATSEKATFGQAVSMGIEASSALAPAGDARLDWLWFLTEDSAPDKDALETMMLTLERSGSAVVAGPKLVDWEDTRRIIELGEGLTWSGARWVLDRQELDQQQYDNLEDVIGVGPVGMLVRRDVWEHLEGFDPALTVYDDALDFSVRARLAGYRVIVVPTARLRFGRNGIAGPEINRKHSVLRRAHRKARQASLHRRLSYAKAFFVPFLWLALPLIGFGGMLWALIRGRPGTMIGEMQAALSVFFKPARILRSRRIIRRNSRVKWKTLKPLRTDRKTVYSVRTIRKEAILAAQGRSREELHFISTGGLALTIVLAVFGVGFTWWLLGATFLNGGGAAPLGSVGQLWQNTVGDYSLKLTDLEGYTRAVPADPLAWVLGIFGSLTFWNPSLSVVLLLILAIPLAGLGGWMWGARLTEHKAARVLSGILWGMGPMLLAAINSGRINSVILAVILPWVLVSVFNAHRSWSWAATASLLSALALAAAPSLIPAAIFMWAVGIVTNPKKSARILLIGLATAALFLPTAMRAVMTKRPLDLLIDPGIALPYEAGTPWQMLLGFPTFGMAGWGEVLSGIGIPAGLQTLTVGFFLAPLAAGAVVGLFTGHPRSTALAALGGAAGLLTAFVSPNLQLSSVAGQPVAVWAGSGLALYWAAVITLAVIGFPALRQFANLAVTVTLIGTLVVVAPSLWKLAINDVALKPDEQQLPAVALAHAETNPDARTVFLTPAGANEMRLEIVTGPAVTLDGVRSVKATQPATQTERNIARAVGYLLGNESQKAEKLLVEERVFAIVLRPSPTAGSALHAEVQAAFDQEITLQAVGETAKGMLWRTVADPAEAPETSLTSEAKTVWVIQIVTLLGLFLLALPLAEVREVPPKRRRGKRRLKPVTRNRLGDPFVKESDYEYDDEDEEEPEETPAEESIDFIKHAAETIDAARANPRVGEEHFEEVGLAGPADLDSGIGKIDPDDDDINDTNEVKLT